MYTPSRFQETDNEKIFAFVRANPFAALVSNDGKRAIATHLPLELEQDGGKLFLIGHVARANPQWRTITQNPEVMAIFNGAHVYISPRWYAASLENVPTWNYTVAHVYGKPETIENRDTLFQAVKKLVDRYEAGSDYSLEKVAPEYVEKLLKAIVGIRVEVTKIEVSFKLSQHHREFPHYQNVIAELERAGDENSLAVAQAMRENLH